MKEAQLVENEQQQTPGGWSSGVMWKSVPHSHISSSCLFISLSFQSVLQRPELRASSRSNHHHPSM